MDKKKKDEIRYKAHHFWRERVAKLLRRKVNGNKIPQSVIRRALHWSFIEQKEYP
jgi:hypothetical protein